jgi:hypothetical protein
MIKSFDYPNKIDIKMGEIILNQNKNFIIITYLILISILLIFIQQWIPVTLEILIIILLYLGNKSYSHIIQIIK